MAVRVPNPYTDSATLPLFSNRDFSDTHRTAVCPEQVLPVKHTLQPTVTGTSVLGFTFDGGVMLAADTLGSYGSLAKLRSLCRYKEVTDKCVVVASGDYADFQYIERNLDFLTVKSNALSDGHHYTPNSIFSYLTRVMYSRRTKINPLWNRLIVGGYEDRTPFLGYVDERGIAYESPTLATGFGLHMSQPLLRDAYENNPALSEAEALSLIERCLKVLYYRDCRAHDKYDVVSITDSGIKKYGPLTLEGNWQIADYVVGYD